ncbi:peptidase E [bacterium]|nr:peptidase E [bacterium]
MKKLLLASNSGAVFDLNYTIDGQSKNKAKWAYIITAGMGQDVSDRVYLDSTKQRMDELGWDSESMDIAGKTENEVYEMLKDKDIIYVQGGNTFYLLKQTRACNFKNVLGKLLTEGKIYIGTSAGSYLMCPTIEMAIWQNRNNFTYHGLKNFTGLNFVPFGIICHYDKYSNEDKIKIKEKVRNSKYDFKFLENGQALLVEDNKITLLK